MDSIQKQNKTIKYLNRDFSTLKESLINFSKIYFPNDYKDFNDSSIGMMFIEMVSYIGDVLSLYTDTQIQENFIQYARNKKSIINLSNFLGYTPTIAGISYVNLDVYQTIPATTYPFQPDWNFATVINNLKVNSADNPDVIFNTHDVINFADSSSTPTEVTVYETNMGGSGVSKYLLKKTVKASSGVVVERDYTITDPQQFYKILLPENDIVEVISIIDSDGNEWKEVDFLAQDLIPDDINTQNIPNFSSNKNDSRYLLRFKKTSKRFTTRIKEDNRLEIEFGAGTSNFSDEIIVPNPDTIAFTYFNKPIDPRNFLNTQTYGEAPANTTLTVKYLRGGDYSFNVPTNKLTNVVNADITTNNALTGADLTTFNTTVKNSLAVNNSSPAIGSKGAETLDEIKQNSRAFFASQDRCVSSQDYEMRILSLHPKYGKVTKVKVVQDDHLKELSQDFVSSGIINNPFSLSAYCLTYDENKNLKALNSTIKENLKNYLDQYRILSDSVFIKDAYIINIGVEFDIITYTGVVNKKEVVLNCINTLKDYFDIDKWVINQPIILSEIYNILDKVDGVRTVSNVNIINKYDANGTTYSNNFYDIGSATIDGIIYPSIDPSIFECKYPDSDIIGRAK